MNILIRLLVTSTALLAFEAEAADVTGDWAARVPTADGERDYTFSLRQSGARLIGTARSQEGVVALSSGTINHNSLSFIENVTVAGRRVVIEYMGEVVSDDEIRFKRTAVAPPYLTVEFVAKRSGPP